jgi:DNA replication protein DnaC
VKLSQRKTISSELLLSSRIPKGYWNKGVESYIGKTKDSWNQCAKYIKRFEEARRDCVGLIFYGTAKSQKTFLISLVLRELICRDYNVMYITNNEVMDILINRKEEFKDLNTDNVFKEPDLLAIDGLEPVSSAFSEEALLRVLKTRLDGGTPTLLSTRQFAENWDTAFKKSIAEIIEASFVPVFCEVDIVKQQSIQGLAKSRFQV